MDTWNSVLIHPWMPANDWDYISCLVRPCLREGWRQGGVEHAVFAPGKGFWCFVLFGNLACQEKKPTSQGWEKKPKKCVLKSQTSYLEDTAKGKIMKHCLSLSGWRMNCIWFGRAIRVYTGQMARCLHTLPSGGQGCCSWGRKQDWTVMAAQQSTS